jgi:hypothetical protein
MICHSFARYRKGEVKREIVLLKGNGRMKSKIGVLLRAVCISGLFLLFLMFPMAVQAQCLCTTNSDNTMTIVEYDGSHGAVILPGAINGMPVTSIGLNAFFYHTNLTSVTIPTSLTIIGDCAFNYCTGLTNIMIGNSVTVIGFQAFGYCPLTSVTIPDSVTTIGGSAFGTCANLTSVYFKGNAPKLGDANVFHDCKNATIYYLPGTKGWEATFGGRPTKLWKQ